MASIRKAAAPLAAIILAMVAAPAMAQEKKPFLDPAAQDQALRLVDAWIEIQRNLDRIPAMSVGVVRGEKLVWSKGYGTVDKGGKIPADTQTVYSICSITKLFTSVAVMRLHDAQKVRLDDDLSSLLPEHRFVQSDPESGPITVRAALTHSGGLPREADFPYWSGPDFAFPTSAQRKERLAQQQTIWRSGSRYQYSNLGMSLLGDVVERASGQPYAQYVQANILDPLGMRSTRFGLPMDLYGKQLAMGYGALKRDGTRDLVNPFKTEGLAAAAGISSNVEDLARFLSWNFRLLRGGAGEILRPATLREMQRVQWTDPDGKTTWGLGYAVRYENAKPVVGHGGNCPGYRSTVRMQPAEELGIIVLINAMVNPGRYSIAVSKILAKAGKMEKPKAGEAAADLEDFAGRYEGQPWNTEVLVVPWGTHLAMLAVPVDDFDTDIVLLKPAGKDAFRRVLDDNTLGTETRFERNAAGKVTRIVSNSQFSVRLD